MSIINTDNGSFRITDAVIITTDKSYSDIRKLAPKNKIWDIKNGYKWIYFNRIEMDNLSFDIGVCYHNEKLFCIHFGFSNKQKKKSTWEDWNEKDELDRKDAYEEWLIKTIGKKRSFEWGDVAADFDPRGGTSSMNIRYK